MIRRFRDRRDGGRQLAARLGHLRREDPIVLGLPRGGVPVADEVARALEAPLDVIVVRKLGVPHQPELGMGAIGETGSSVLNEEVIRLAGVKPHQISAVQLRENGEIERRTRRFRGGRAPLSLEGRTVIVVDDGIATGGTARAALQVARVRGAARVVLAVPVAAADSLRQLEAYADEIVCLQTPPAFFAVGEWYGDFSQTSDDEVTSILARASTATVAADPPAVHVDTDVEIGLDRLRLAGHLTVPHDANGMVVFAHGSGSSRHSPRNRSVSSALNGHGLATLLFDLLTNEEERDRSNVFDVRLLGERLTRVTDWLRTRPEVARLPVGYFGASTGAAAALWAAAEPTSCVGAIVSRGGRPDLAGERLSAVRAPTLLIVGGADNGVLELNGEAAKQLRCEHGVAIVPRATHLFEEPGALETVADLAAQWFARHLTSARRAA